MNGRSHWQLDPDLRAVLPKAWKTWELYREDLAGVGVLAQEAGRFLAGGLEPLGEPAPGLSAERPRAGPKRRALLEGLSPLIRTPFEGRGWPYLFTAAYLLGSPTLSYLLSSTSGAVFVLGKYAPEFGALKAQLQGGAAWAAAWLGWQARGQAHDEAWRLNGRYDLAPGIGVAEYVLLTAEHGGEERGLFLLPRHNRRGRLNYRSEVSPGAERLSVPYGPAELDGSEAYLLGHPEEGRHYAAEVSTLQQIAQALAWAGLGRHLQLEAAELPELHASPDPDLRYTLTDWAVRLAGALALGFRAVAAWDRTRQEYPPYENLHFSQLLALLAKTRAAEHAARVAHGLARTLGPGLLRLPGLARLVEEVKRPLPWEAPAHAEAVQARELLLHQRVGPAFRADFVRRLQMAHRKEASLAAEAVSGVLDGLQASGSAEALWAMPQGLRRLADAAAVALLYDLEATSGGRYARLGELYARRFLLGEPYPVWAMTEPRLWSTAPQASSG
jgi:hypothetical protein